jgi:hypothetical protein
MCPALHDHLFTHHPFQLGRKAIPTASLRPATHDPQMLPILRPPQIPMLFLRARDMSRSRGPFRSCNEARGGQASGNMARCARVPVFSGLHGAEGRASTGRDPGGAENAFILRARGAPENASAISVRGATENASTVSVRGAAESDSTGRIPVAASISLIAVVPCAWWALWSVWLGEAV